MTHHNNNYVPESLLHCRVHTHIISLKSTNLCCGVFASSLRRSHQTFAICGFARGCGLRGTTSPFMTNLHVETKMWSDAMFARGGLRGTLKMSWVSSQDPWHFKWDSDQLMGISMKGVGRLWLKFNILKLSLHMMTMMWPDSIFFQWQVKGDWQNQIHSHSPATDLEYRAVCNSLQCNSN